MTTEYSVRIQGLVKRFGNKTVLDRLDLSVPRHQSLVVVGASGSGKSVLLKCILGLVRPDAGRIEINGVDVTQASASARREAIARIGMLFQGGALFDSLRVWENVAFALLYGQGRARMAHGKARAHAVTTLAAVGLSADVGDLYPAELSGGMQKRVGLARAIVGEPDILFFDEPTTGLDPIMGAVIDELIVRCVHKLGATALSITHDMGSVRRIADQVAVLRDGRFIWQGAVGEIERSGDAYVDRFIHGRAPAASEGM